MQCSGIGEACVAKPPGTLIRIPGPPRLCYIFLQVLRCSAPGREYQMPPDLNCQVASGQDPMNQADGLPWSPVNKRVDNPKSPTGPGRNRPQNGSFHHQIGPNTP